MTTIRIARRSLLGATALGGLLLGADRSAWGQAASPAYPTRPITLVVPYGPGSSLDNAARPVARALQEALGQPVVIENRGGANGVIGTQYAARARPDGYTLLAGSSTTLAANVGLFRALPYDPIRDFVPISGMARTSMIFVTRADFPARDMQHFLAMARESATPLAIAYGSSSAQVALALLTKVSGVDSTPVPYRDTPGVLTDLMGGQVAMGIVDIGNAVPYLGDGRLNGLAMSGPVRSPFAPSVPTMAEFWPGTELVNWLALVAPAGTPTAITEKLERTVAAILAKPEIQQQFASMGTEIEVASREELANRLPRDQALWVDLIKLAGIEAQ